MRHIHAVSYSNTCGKSVIEATKVLVALNRIIFIFKNLLWVKTENKYLHMCFTYNSETWKGITQVELHHISRLLYRNEPISCIKIETSLP